MVFSGRGAVLVSLLSIESSPTYSLRLSNAAFFGRATGLVVMDGRACLRGSSLQHPPPQHIFPKRLVPPRMSPSILWTSSEFWDIKTVDARLRRWGIAPGSLLSAYASSSAASLDGSVIGVSGTSESTDTSDAPVTEVAVDCESDAPVAERRRRVKCGIDVGSSGIGSFGCDVEVSGIGTGSSPGRDDNVDIVREG